jgi:hypothetical protein
MAPCESPRASDASGPDVRGGADEGGAVVDGENHELGCHSLQRSASRPNKFTDRAHLGVAGEENGAHMRTVRVRLLYSVVLAVMAAAVPVLGAAHTVVAMIPAGAKWG